MTSDNGNVKRAILAAILERKATIEELRKRLLKIEVQIEQSLCHAKEELDEQSALDLAREFYWNWSDDIKADYLRLLLGLKHAGQVSRVVGPIEIVIQCKDCNEEFTHIVTSRTDLANYETSYRSRGTWFSHLCEKCRARRKAEQGLTRKRRRQYNEQRLEQLRSMPYQEYLRTEEWQDTRKRALKRAGYRCSICNAGKCELHTHHRSYQNLGQEMNRDVIVLCKDCHELFHEQSGVKS